MKVFQCPDECPEPTVDYRNFDLKKVQADEEAHKVALAEHLKKIGYTGKLTGEIVQYPVADGYALYMFAEGKKTVLIHLGYGDGYHYHGIEHFPKKAVVAELERRKALSKIFEKKD
jgi:hypothetical protein